MVAILPPTAAHAGVIEDLLDQRFGPDRQIKTSYRFRDGVAPLDSLARIAVDDDGVVGTLQYWPMLLVGEPVLLLGPLAVVPARANQGIGRALIAASLAAAQQEGWRHVFLVGDYGYYARFGFQPASNWGVSMPNEQQHRLLGRVIGTNLPPAAGALQPALANNCAISAAAS